MFLFGIPTCDTCRKARKALEAAGHSVTFRDVRAEPLSGEEIARFMAAFGDRILNRSSTTWRALPEDQRAADLATLLALHPTLMKRPVIDTGAELYLGWDKANQAALLG
ncbi:arsenate reductase family protein [Plastorhodobacter daqingensis]|uniref:Arsenate reductase family protein n=1 Tax=Plastorhodobacter daqingensis TaxID=1387281 RepID=A0ABW2UK15_9RHOB